MKFENAPVIQTTSIYREARVSPVRGNTVLRRLTQTGRIDPVFSPTGRVSLTPPQGRVLFDALTRSG